MVNLKPTPACRKGAWAWCAKYRHSSEKRTPASWTCVEPCAARRELGCVKYLTMTEPTSPDRSDLVAYWSVPLLDGVHTIEFEHGTTSGKRVLRIDGKEVLRKEWMFKLVGDIRFTLGKQEAICELRVDPIPKFDFAYSLWIDGMPADKFRDKYEKSVQTWNILADGKRCRIAIDKTTLDIFVDGKKTDAEVEFIEEGSQYVIPVGNQTATIRSGLAKGQKQMVVFRLYLGDKLVSDD